MAGRFPLYTDADVQGRVVDALKQTGWDILRAIDAYPERTEDTVHFERAAREGRVFVTNDQRIEFRLARIWVETVRPFRGMVCWPQSYYGVMSPGDFVDAFEELARQDDPFGGYPVIHLSKKSKM